MPVPNVPPYDVVLHSVDTSGLGYNAFDICQARESEFVVSWFKKKTTNYSHMITKKGEELKPCRLADAEELFLLV